MKCVKIDHSNPLKLLLNIYNTFGKKKYIKVENINAPLVLYYIFYFCIDIYTMDMLMIPFPTFLNNVYEKNVYMEVLLYCQCYHNILNNHLSFIFKIPFLNIKTYNLLNFYIINSAHMKIG
jgi:hypothetical protein